jgi:Na+-transporting NADH:ubiquinone oxidoreductase subunit NqrD
MINTPPVRDWLGPGPLGTSVLIGVAAACLRRFFLSKKLTSISLVSSLSISLVAGGGSAVVALVCGASSDSVAMLAGLTIVYSVADAVERLLPGRIGRA